MVGCISVRDYDEGDGVDAGATTVGAYHPGGYAAPEIHGIEMNMQVEDCRECHGTDLAGGTAVSCDTGGCHTVAQWRTTCTYCHGGLDSNTGAPPRDMDGTATHSFLAHGAHEKGKISNALACTECHAKPVDALSAGHVFDGTAGRAEVNFGGGLAKATSWNGSNSCSSSYCHGNGNGANGTVSHTKTNIGCGDCHAGQDSGLAKWTTMSGAHAKHMNAGSKCSECHAQTAGANTIVNTSLHVNGRIEYSMSGTGITESSGRCTGFCHNRGHFFSGW